MARNGGDSRHDVRRCAGIDRPDPDAHSARRIGGARAGPVAGVGFAAAFLRSIHAVEPLVADAVVVTYWRRDDTTALRHAVELADSVCFDGQVRTVRAATPVSLIRH